VDDQICRIGAQVFHSHHFLTTNPVQAQKNAQAYSLSNNKKQISKMRSRIMDPDISDDEIQDQLEGLALVMVQQLQERLNHTSNDPSPTNDNDE
jgi:hypothetical protein